MYRIKSNVDTRSKEFKENQALYFAGNQAAGATNVSI